MLPTLSHTTVSYNVCQEKVKTSWENSSYRSVRFLTLSFRIVQPSEP